MMNRRDVAVERLYNRLNLSTYAKLKIKNLLIPTSFGCPMAVGTLIDF